ncbi:MAG: hypothetical protein HY619_04435 [Thaumarchaeota archaeon]|nr:hypothetical protein [Nitrososphaerota archaeon]
MIEVLFTVFLALLVVGLLFYSRRNVSNRYLEVNASQRSSSGSLYATSIYELRAAQPNFKGSLGAMVTILDSKLLPSSKLSGDSRRRANRLRDRISTLLNQKTVGKDIFASAYSEYEEITRILEEKGI